MPKISVVIPVHNAEKFIAKTIDSVLAQTFTDFECIIVNDGSTDSTGLIVGNYTDERILLITIGASGGPARPRNTGIDAAQGDYIFLFDADDLMATDKLAKSLAAFERYPNTDFLFTNFCSIDEDDKILNANYLATYDSFWALLDGEPKIGDQVFVDASSLYRGVVAVNFIGTSSVGLRRVALTKQDRFNEQLKNSDDRLFWMLFCETHNAVFVNEVLHSYRIQQSGISNKSFIVRGPSKIHALLIAEKKCKVVELKKVLRQQIAKDYASLAYAYRNSAMYKMQLINAINSLSYGWSFIAFKMLFFKPVKL